MINKEKIIKMMIMIKIKTNYSLKDEKKLSRKIKIKIWKIKKNNKK